MDTLALLLHPVRLRIVHALSGGQTRTTSELCARLPDVSKATVYRQVSLLTRGGLLEVASERRTHGAVERSYRLHRARATVDPRAGAAMSKDEHREAFASAIAALVAEFNTYLDRPDANPYRDAVGYTQASLWLSRRELADIQRIVRAAIVASSDHLAGTGRRLYLLSPIMFPIEGPAELDPDLPPREQARR
jgi:DNA-binding transcriptional ArsR family regulator